MRLWILAPLLFWSAGCRILLNSTPQEAEALAIPETAPTLNIRSSFGIAEARFTNSDSAHSSFQCKLASQSNWTTCTAPFDMTNFVARNASDTLSVRSVNSDGDAGPISSKAFTRGFALNGVNVDAEGVAFDSDGSRFAVGAFNAILPMPAPFAFALGSDLKPQSLFGNFNSSVFGFIEDTNQKILVYGLFSEYEGDASAPNSLLRLNSDGSIDTAFAANLGAGFSGGISAAALQNDGKIVVGGTFSGIDGNFSIPQNILRLEADGTVDTSFSSFAGVGFDGMVTSIAVQSDGKIVVGGDFTQFDNQGSTPDRIARLNSDGSEDTTFGSNAGSGASSQVSAVKVQSNGKIVLGGSFTSFNGSGAAPDMIIRLNSDGTVDATFSSNAGVGLNGNVNSIAIQSGDEILVGGSFTSYAGSALASDKILRLSSTGVIDTTFRTNADGGADGDVYSVMASRSGGRIYIGGNFEHYAGTAVSFGLLRLDPSGIIDTSYTAVNTSGANGLANGLGELTDGKILVSGNMTLFGGTSPTAYGIVKFKSSNELDSTFMTNIGTGADGSIKTIATQTDGKIVIGGSFTSFNGDASASDYLLRLNVDGTQDTTFSGNVASLLDGGVQNVAIQTDGKILAYGDFTGVGGTPAYIRRFNADGTQDTAFNTAAGVGFDAFSSPGKMVVRPDGKIILTGAFTSYAGNAATPNGIICLNDDGSENATFRTNATAGLGGLIYGMAVDDTNKTIVVGPLWSYAGNGSLPGSTIVRINADGTEDTAFTAAQGTTGLDASLTAVAIQKSDGKILLGGDFSSFDGDTSVPNSIARFNSDGSLDTAFNANLGTGLNSSPYAIAVNPTNGDIFAGGTFKLLDQTYGVNRLMLLDSTGILKQ